MNKLLLITLMFVVCTSSVVQAKKCSYDIDKKDEFSGKTTRSTSATLAKSWKMIFSKSDEVYSISVYLLLPGEINTGVNKGDSLLIKLTDGEIIRLVSENDVAPRSYVAGTGAYAAIVTDFTPLYLSTKEDFEKISKAGISVVRVFIGTQFMEVSVKKKDGKKISRAAQCILE